MGCSFKMFAGVQRASKTRVSMKWSICDNMAATVCCVWYPDIDEHCVILWPHYKNKWCQVYDSSVSVSCNRQLVTQWSFVQHCSLHCNILDNDWDYNTSIRDDYSDNHYYILLCFLLQPFWEPHWWCGVCCSFKVLAGVQRAPNTFVSMNKGLSSLRRRPWYEVIHTW